MITGYNDLLLAVQQMISGQDANENAIDVAILTRMVQMGEKRVYREVRSRHNEKAFTGTVTGNLFPIPADFEACSTVHFGNEPLLPVSDEWLQAYNDMTQAGQCRYFAEAGANFTFGPAVADGTALQGRYFFRFPNLTASNFSSNALIQQEADVFLYATLCEAAPMFEQDNRVPLWEAKYTAIRDRLNTAKTRAAFSGGRARISNSTRLLG